MMVVAIDLQVGVEGEPAVLGVPSPFPSEAPKSAAGADAAFEPAVVAVAVAAEVIVRWLSSQH